MIETCSLCGVNEGLVKSHVNTPPLQDDLASEHFQTLFCATIELCSICSDVLKMWVFLLKQKQQIIVEIKKWEHEISKNSKRRGSAGNTTAGTCQFINDLKLTSCHNPIIFILVLFPDSEEQLASSSVSVEDSINSRTPKVMREAAGTELEVFNERRINKHESQNLIMVRGYILRLFLT